MSFSWLLHLLQFPGSAHPFYEHCPYYSKKSIARQEKIFQKSPVFCGFVHISTDNPEKIFDKKGIFRFFQKSFTTSCIQYLFPIFLDKFFIEPVDNFCYTKDNHALLYISTGFTKDRLCYPQLVYNFVDNFFFFVKKLWTFRSVNYRISLRKTGFAALWILCRRKRKEAVHNIGKTDGFPRFTQGYPVSLWISSRQKKIKKEVIAWN